MKKIVDERQEFEMYKAEHIGFTIMIFALAIVICIQSIIYQADFERIVGETVVLFIGGITSVVATIRNGNYDFYQKPGMKSYIGTSAVASAICGIVLVVRNAVQFEMTDMKYIVVVFVASFVMVFVLCFIVLAGMGTYTKRRRKKLEDQLEEELDDSEDEELE